MGASSTYGEPLMRQPHHERVSRGFVDRVPREFVGNARYLTEAAPPHVAHILFDLHTKPRVTLCALPIPLAAGHRLEPRLAHEHPRCARCVAAFVAQHPPHERS